MIGQIINTLFLLVDIINIRHLTSSSPPHSEALYLLPVRNKQIIQTIASTSTSTVNNNLLLLVMYDLTFLDDPHDEETEEDEVGKCGREVDNLP